MLKSKKVLGLLCAVGMLIGSCSSVFASVSSTPAKGSLNSCGDITGVSYAWYEGYHYAKSETQADSNAYRIKAEMQAVNRNTGSTVASDVDNRYYSSYADAIDTDDYNVDIAVYGTHQAWGTGSNEYWGAYTSCYE